MIEDIVKKVEDLEKQLNQNEGVKQHILTELSAKGLANLEEAKTEIENNAKELEALKIEKATLLAKLEGLTDWTIL